MDNFKVRTTRKDIIYAFMLFIFCIYCFFLGASCRTTATEPIPDTGTQHSIEIGRIQGAVESYGRTVEAITANLSERAGSLSDSLDELSVYLERYFSEVQQLLQRYGALQKYVSTGSFKEQDFDTYVNCLYPIANNPDNR